LFERKIDPITNGISSMEKFQPIEQTRTEEPTCVMLSNVQFIKDVKTAVAAAAVIINEYGFKKYHLVVYGAQDRQPAYAIETEEMINKMGVQDTVRLGGFGTPNEVLKDAWLFMNSSLSEGLPLAIGEAALSGIPIVATEVGATAQVLTDADDASILYGEVVPPNDPVSLARAQLSLLAMLGPWARYTTDARAPPALPSKFSAADVEWITARMYDKAADRRRLGLKLREVVLRKFSGERYLREHEQMYWVQRHMSEQRDSARLARLAASHPRLGQPLPARLVEVRDPESMWAGRWQDFEGGRARRVRAAVEEDDLDEEERMIKLE
jgi:glycosyltransferase involved in cell wall biosynthesis